MLEENMFEGLENNTPEVEENFDSIEDFRNWPEASVFKATDSASDAKPSFGSTPAFHPEETASDAKPSFGSTPAFHPEETASEAKPSFGSTPA